MNAGLKQQLRRGAAVAALILPAAILFTLAVDAQPDALAVLVSAVGTTLIVGGPILTAELMFVGAPTGQRFRRRPLWQFLALRFGAWAAWILLGTLIANQLVWAEPLAEPLATGRFWLSIAFSFAIGLTSVFLLTVDELLGPGVLINLLRGRYHRPSTEERAVVFLDMKNSTGLTERLGPERFLDLLGRFVAMVSQEVRRAGGATYDYQGDGVILVWDGRRTADLTPAAAMLRRLKARLQAEARGYQADFGTVPDFRAALHVGPVVVSEIGDDKRAIVLLGDTMNTAARLEQAARDLGHDLVCSAEAARRIGPILGVTVTALAPIALRGKAEPVAAAALNLALGGGPGRRAGA